MQFRERRRVIQVIRTTYDPELKRGRSEVVGKIDKAAPTVTDKLQKTCTPEELAEIGAYLASRHESQRTEAVRAGAETLPDEMRKAAEYFRTHQGVRAMEFAAEIRAAWDELKAAMRKAGFSKDKVKQRGAKAAQPVAQPVDSVVAEAAPAAPAPEAPAAAKPARKPPRKPVPKKPAPPATPAAPAE